MIRYKWILPILLLTAGISLAACHSENGSGPAAAQETNIYEDQAESGASEASLPVTEETSASGEASLGELQALIGMEDSSTAEMFGGSQENWTEDKAFYIGRIFEITLMGQTYPMYTSCDDNNIVNFVSVWIANGSRQVTEEEARGWEEAITASVGAEPTYDDTSSEGGSKNWKWVSDQTIISLHWMDKILSLSINPAVGELK